MEIPLGRKVLEANDKVAEILRGQFRERGLTVINMVSSPGAGKTSLLERLCERLAGRIPMAVIEGDLATDADARRLAPYGIPVHQIVTGTTCHLDAGMIQSALERLPLDGIRLLIIENVGNLVCPASYDLGEQYRVVVISVTEGEDKPLKYPPVFTAASAVVINKVDLLPYLKFDMPLLRDAVHRMNPGAVVLETSCSTPEGALPWTEWVAARIGAD